MVGKRAERWSPGISPPAYACSKAALGQLTRVAAASRGQYDVNVNAVAPGVTRTPMFYPGGDDPDRLEKAVCEGPLANFARPRVRTRGCRGDHPLPVLPDSRQITGQTIHASAGSVV